MAPESINKGAAEMEITRQEARRRIDAAERILLDHGWTAREVERSIEGLMREDAVERIEEHAKAALGLA